MVPNLVLSPIAGTFVDRWDQKQVLVVSGARSSVGTGGDAEARMGELAVTWCRTALRSDVDNADATFRFSLNEYFTVQRAVEQVARSQPATVAEARAAFDKQKELEYSISSITGKDLIITKENDKVVVAVAYDKLVPIYGPVYILIKYEGRSR